MWGKKVKVWISDSVLNSMIDHADNAYPNEAGGALMGYWNDKGTEVLVTQVVGPGPEAVHERTSFVPDYSFQEREIERIYIESGRTHTYLGDWHSHPNGPASLSGTDTRTMRNIAEYAAARATSPVMILFSGSQGSWNRDAWQFRKRKLHKANLEVYGGTP